MVAVNYDWDELEDNIDEEYDDAGVTVAEYTTEPEQYGNVVSQRRDGQSSFLHCDGLGSTLALTNAAGTVTDTWSYTAFGEVTERTGSTENPFQYVGQKGYYRCEETGGYSVRRRLIDDQHGRWLSADPLGISHHIHHTYRYSSNSPLMAIDPSGLICLCWPCVCDSLTFTEIGWRIWNHPGGRIRDYPFGGRVLGYAWCAHATSSGDNSCTIWSRIPAIAGAIGTIEEKWDDGEWQGVQGGMADVLWRSWQDSTCDLPSMFSGTYSSINCQSKWANCQGEMLLLDTPGGVFDYRNHFFWRIKPQRSYCVRVNVTFEVQCLPVFNLWPRITKNLDINAQACITVNGNGDVIGATSGNKSLDLNELIVNSSKDILAQC